MSDTVDLNGILYYDATGYVTHVQIELDQYLPYQCGDHVGNVRTAAFSVPVRNGEAVLPCPGAEQVFRITVQPIAAHETGEKRPIGAPLVAVAPGGVFYDWAVLQTIGELIERTILESSVLSTPAGNIPLPDELRFEARLARRIVPQEASALDFEYYDDGPTSPQLEANKQPRAQYLDVTIEGVKEEANGLWRYPDVKPVQGNPHQFKISLKQYQDITRIDLQPFSGPDQPYGNPVTLSPSAASYVVSMAAEGTGDAKGVVINRTVHVAETTPSAVQSPSGNILVAAPRQSGKDGSNKVRSRKRPAEKK